MSTLTKPCLLRPKNGLLIHQVHAWPQDSSLPLLLRASSGFRLGQSFHKTLSDRGLKNETKGK